MDNFAFVVHPLDPKRDVARKYPVLVQVLPTTLIRWLARRWPPLLLSRVAGIRSRDTGTRVEGWLLACPLTAGQMLELPPQVVYDKVVHAGRLAQRQGARLLGLGALISMVGDGGVTIAQRLGIPVTTGNSLTVGVAVETLRQVTRRQGLELERATAAVVGASGTIGLACAEMLAPFPKRLILIGRRGIRLSQARAQAEAAGAAKVQVSPDVHDIREADAVLFATSTLEPILQPRHLKEQAIVCDVAQPPVVTPEVRRQRGDATFVSGAQVRLPEVVSLGFDLGLPPGHAHARMVETIVLALEGRYESYSLGQKVSLAKAREVVQLARRHGFLWPVTSMSQGSWHAQTDERG